MLNPLPVDLLELSGGSYESPAMQERTADGRTLAREAYFLEIAPAGSDCLGYRGDTGVFAAAQLPKQVLAQAAMVGMGTALAIRTQPAGAVANRAKQRGRTAGRGVEG